MAVLRGVLGRAERDPALLAFIKCHLTSMARWNILRVLSEDPGYQWPPDEVARLAHGSGDATRRSLEALADEGLVERHDGPDGPFYALEGTGPTARLLARLQIEAARNHGLRQIIVARMLEDRGSAASPLHGHPVQRETACRAEITVSHAVIRRGGVDPRSNPPLGSVHQAPRTAGRTTRP